MEGFRVGGHKLEPPIVQPADPVRRAQELADELQVALSKRQGSADDGSRPWIRNLGSGSSAE